jgi:hypothetical protein
MEVQRKESVHPLSVRLTHEQYHRLLDGAAEIDLRFPWLAQCRYLICIATIGDEGVWLKLSSCSGC